LIDTPAGHHVTAQKQRHRVNSIVAAGVGVAVHGAGSAALSPGLAIEGRKDRKQGQFQKTSSLQIRFSC
jgi:hypothetical protein